MIQLSMKGDFSGMSFYIALRTPRLGASVQRANRPQLGACTSLGGTAKSTSRSGSSTTLVARRLCSEGQPPSAWCLHQPGRHSHTHIRVRYRYHPRGSDLLNYLANYLCLHPLHHKQDTNHAQNMWKECCFITQESAGIQCM